MSFEEIIMRKARFTKHQIIAVLKSVESGCTVKDVCRDFLLAKYIDQSAYTVRMASNTPTATAS